MSEVDVAALRRRLEAVRTRQDFAREFGPDDIWRFLGALERCRQHLDSARQHLREKNDIIRAYAGPGGMSPEDIAASLEQAQRLEKAANQAYDRLLTIEGDWDTLPAALLEAETYLQEGLSRRKAALEGRNG